MDENKNITPEENQVLSGFDSVSPTSKSTQEGFNPTPMFSNLQKENSEHLFEKTNLENTFPNNDKTANTAENEQSESLKTDKPQSAKTPEEKSFDFIPSGTYSYSAANGNLKSSAYNTPEPKPEPTFFAAPPIDTFDTSFGEENKPKDKRNKYGAGVVILSALLAAIIGAGSAFGGTYLLKDKLFSAESSDTPSLPQNVTNIEVDETVNSSVEAVAKKAGPSVVGIRTTAAINNYFFGSAESTGEGSGIIYSTDGYIITNYHVIQPAVESSNAKVEVFLADDTETAINATVVGYNIASDLAVVKINKSGLTAIDFANSDKLQVGQYTVAIGNPGGLEFIGSVSYGVISGLNRSVSVDSGTTMSLIQTDAAINPGNSGGALVDLSGKLIGVNSIKLVSTGYEGMGFAIPSNTVKKICDNIIAKQNTPTPYVGIEISQNYTAEQLKALGYPAGAVVINVAEGGPAAESDIKRGDIITEFNGTTINNYNDLESAISQCSPGDTVTVKIFRAGRFYSANINIKANNAQ